jgi:hypothetical protein
MANTTLNARAATTINLGNAGNAQGIAGNLTLNGPASSLSVQVNDSADAAAGHNATLAAGSLTGLTPGAINFTASMMKSLTVSAGAGNDTLAVSTAPTFTTTVDLGAGTNTLIGPNAVNSWMITSANHGTLDSTLTFSNAEKLVGGTGVDIFKFSAAGNVSTVTGGGAPPGMGDWLDYSGFTTSVTVNLATGSATSAGFVTGIQDVHGGNGGNKLTGDSQGNILIGGAGADTIQGGTGRSLLIGDKGSDNIKGGSGGMAAGGDILIGGYTTYDSDTVANIDALMAIFAEWQSADSYAMRFSKIDTGAIAGGYKLNYGTTVQDDGIADTLTAATSGSSTPAVDWFFAGALDTINNFETGEHKNNS